MCDLEKRLAEASQPGWESVRSGLIERADRDSLIDLAYQRHESPFGTLLVFAGGGGIVRVALASEQEEEVLETLGRRISPRIALAGRETLADARRQLDRYFDGRLQSFDLPLDWRLTGGFRREVLRQTARIPYGSVASYADLAERAGSPRAVRAAGSALATNPLPVIVPCHRVVRSDGATGSYLGGPAMKESLLAMERETAVGAG